MSPGPGRSSARGQPPLQPHFPTVILASVLLVSAILASAIPVSAAPVEPVPPQRVDHADSLRVFLLTFEPGAAVWERFGHNAIWIHDPDAGTDIAYHWGLFDMSEEGFLLEFLKGRMVYSMGANDAPRLIEAYRRAGREVTIQELAFTAAQAAELQAHVEWNFRPENRSYRYDYFQDNCSTRVRDALDRALGGALLDDMRTRPSAFTFRSQAVQLTGEDALLTTGMDLGLGPLADQPITRWELSFIPMRLREDVRRVTVSRGGAEVPLVTSERELDPVVPGDPSMAEPSSPVRRVLGHLLVGLLLAGIIVAAALIATRDSASPRSRTAARSLVGVVGSAWGLMAGVLGLILLALWALTDHEFAWRNENLLQTNPLALGLVVLVPLVASRPHSPWASRATKFALLLVGLSVLGLLLHPFPVTPQANLPIIALALPVHLALFYALRRIAANAP